MSKLRKQEIKYIKEIDKDGNIEIDNYWVEILAWTYLIDDLVTILSLSNPVLKDRGIYTFDEKILSLLHRNKEKIKELFGQYKNVSINLYPETIIKIMQDKRKYSLAYHYLKELAQWYITNVEIVENGIDASELIHKRKKILTDIKEELGLAISLDDVSIQILEAKEEKILRGNFFLSELRDYLTEWVISTIKLDLKVTRMAVENDRYMDYIFHIFQNTLSWCNTGLTIIFEGIENIEDYNKLMRKIREEIQKGWLDLSQINIAMQWFYFDKPSRIEGIE